MISCSRFKCSYAILEINMKISYLSLICLLLPDSLVNPDISPIDFSLHLKWMILIHLEATRIDGLLIDILFRPSMLLHYICFRCLLCNINSWNFTAYLQVDLTNWFSWFWKFQNISWFFFRCFVISINSYMVNILNQIS